MQQRNKFYKVPRKERKQEVMSNGKRASCKKRTDEEEKVVDINIIEGTM